MSTIYLLHLDTPLRHAKHYIGLADDLDARLERWLKRKKGAGWFCPICAGDKALKRAGKETKQ